MYESHSCGELRILFVAGRSANLTVANLSYSQLITARPSSLRERAQGGTDHAIYRSDATRGKPNQIKPATADGPRPRAYRWPLPAGETGSFVRETDSRTPSHYLLYWTSRGL